MQPQQSEEQRVRTEGQPEQPEPPPQPQQQQLQQAPQPPAAAAARPYRDFDSSMRRMMHQMHDLQQELFQWQPGSYLPATVPEQPRPQQPAAQQPPQAPSQVQHLQRQREQLSHRAPWGAMGMYDPFSDLSSYGPMRGFGSFEHAMRRMDDLAEEMLRIRPSFSQPPLYTQPFARRMMERMDDLAQEMLSTRPLRSRPFPLGFEETFAMQPFSMPIWGEDLRSMHSSLSRAMRNLEDLSAEMLRSLQPVMSLGGPEAQAPAQPAAPQPMETEPAEKQTEQAQQAQQAEEHVPETKSEQTAGAPATQAKVGGA